MQSGYRNSSATNRKNVKN